MYVRACETTSDFGEEQCIQNAKLHTSFADLIVFARENSNVTIDDAFNPRELPVDIDDDDEDSNMG